MSAAAGNDDRPPSPKSRFAWLQADVTPLLNGMKALGYLIFLIISGLAFLAFVIAVFWSAACYRRPVEPTTPAPKFDDPYLRKVDPAVQNRIRELELKSNDFPGLTQPEQDELTELRGSLVGAMPKKR